MSSEKPDLARAGTMQVTAKEGKVYLDKNLTEWKKPFLADHLQEEQEEEAPAPTKGKGKAKLSKHTTMKGTAKEADALLGDKRPDPDAGTRGQQKKIEELSSPPPKRAKKASGAADLKKANTINKTLEEAKALYGDLDMSGGRSLRKRPEKAKPALKKAGTMQNTAKEGKAFLKRQKKGAGKKKKEEKIEEEEEDQANGDADDASD